MSDDEITDVVNWLRGRGMDIGHANARREIAEQSLHAWSDRSISREEHENELAMERYLHECQLAMRESALWRSNERRGWLDQIQVERERRIKTERERNTSLTQLVEASARAKKSSK